MLILQRVKMKKLILLLALFSVEKIFTACGCSVNSCSSSTQVNTTTPSNTSVAKQPGQNRPKLNSANFKKNKKQNKKRLANNLLKKLNAIKLHSNRNTLNTKHDLQMLKLIKSYLNKYNN